MPPLLLKLAFTRVARAPMPFFARPIARRPAYARALERGGEYQLLR